MSAAIHRPPSKLLMSILLGGLSMFGPFTIDTLFPAFPMLGADLHVDKLALQQTLSVYLLAYAVASIFQGPLSDAIGRRPTILGGLLLFALASAGCAFSVSFTELLVWRALQGLTAGVGMVVGRAIIRDLFEGHDAQRLMSQVSMIFGIAPALAPIIGGWLLPHGGWHGIFWFLVGLGLLWMLACFLALPETLPKANRFPMRPRALFQGYAAILGNGRFVLLGLCGVMNFGAFFLYIASAPRLVLEILGLDTDQFGWLFIPAISGIVIGSFINGRLAGRLNGVETVRLGFRVVAAAACGNVVYALLFATPSLPWAVLPVMLNGIGVALVFPILTLAILDMYPRQRGAASAMQAFIGLGVNAITAGLVAPLVNASMITLAVTAALYSLLAWGIWRWYLSQRQDEDLPGDGDTVTAGPAERA